MGLPLYNPPVESDIAPSKPISERRTAIARSRIRGSGANATANAGTHRPRRSGHELIQQRIRNLAQQTRELRRQPSLRTLALHAPAGSSEATALVIDDAAEGNSPRSIRDVTRDIFRLQQDVCAGICDREASVPSDRPGEPCLRAIYLTPELSRPERVHAVAAFAMQPFIERNPSLLEDVSTLLTLCYSWLDGAEETEAFRADFQRGIDSARLHFSNRAASAFQRTARRRRTLARMMRDVHADVDPEMFGPPSSSGMDGLGDRNRSLSPEGYDVWDTLLYTVTPDPQPASAGSSFTSASASVVASQSASAAHDQSSAATSFTNPDPDTAGESIWQEIGCESENGDDAASDLDEDGMALVAVPAAPDAPIDLTEGDGNEPTPREERERAFASFLRRIAERRDIPDSLLAEVGLSRIIPASDSLSS